MFYESWGYIFTYYFENKKKSEYNGLKFLISFQVFYLYFHMMPCWRGVWLFSKAMGWQSRTKTRELQNLGQVWNSCLLAKLKGWKKSLLIYIQFRPDSD